jgi:hypothetical protein
VAGIFSFTPQVLAADFGYDTEPFKLRFAFNANVAASIGLSDITVRNLTTNTTIAPTSVSWDSSNNAGVFQFGSLLPNGSYSATLKASGISDGTHTLAADFVYSFFVLAADGNRDRSVDTVDLNVLTANFGKVGRTFSQGNYDYSADGSISTTDFNFLAGNFGMSAARRPAPSPGLSASDTHNLDWTTRMIDDVLA